MILKEIYQKQAVKIVTVTLNPVLDRTLWVEDFQQEKTLIASCSESFAGGKGVNVARALKNLNIKSTVTGFLPCGGSDFYTAILNKEHIKHRFLYVKGLLRINTTIISDKAKRETHIREKGPLLTADTISTFRLLLKKLVDVNTMVVLSGSLPSGISTDTYNTLIKDIKSKGALSVLDTSGDSLLEGLKAKPYLIKPNISEVKDACGFLPGSFQELVKAVKILHSTGIPNVIISMGSEGLIFSRGKDIIHVRCNIQKPLNTVGSGDAALAGAISGIIWNKEDKLIAGLACAAGAANTLTLGACKFKIEMVEKLLQKVEYTICRC